MSTNDDDSHRSAQTGTSFSRRKYARKLTPEDDGEGDVGESDDGLGNTDWELDSAEERERGRVYQVGEGTPCLERTPRDEREKLQHPRYLMSGPMLVRLRTINVEPTDEEYKSLVRDFDQHKWSKRKMREIMDAWRMLENGKRAPRLSFTGFE